MGLILASFSRAAAVSDQVRRRGFAPASQTIALIDLISSQMARFKGSYAQMWHCSKGRRRADSARSAFARARCRPLCPTRGCSQGDRLVSAISWLDGSGTDTIIQISTMGTSGRLVCLMSISTRRIRTVPLLCLKPIDK